MRKKPVVSRVPRSTASCSARSHRRGQTRRGSRGGRRRPPGRVVSDRLPATHAPASKRKGGLASPTITRAKQTDEGHRLVIIWHSKFPIEMLQSGGCFLGRSVFIVKKQNCLRWKASSIGLPLRPVNFRDTSAYFMP